ncbi:hypothetical protein KP509_38G037400 [Ceratopteris richardii]|uniref:DUF7642 domain-containing protein n=1 Tax=Ceratopteris richardii TaxID=49495 RepID=A0A8T2Q3Z5_CERRI|nr:hypothetical protein KP509_38G037400 [Ceratopteris richardii]
MGSVDGQSEEDYVEAGLLTDPVGQCNNAEGGKVLHSASFSDFERRFLSYETLQWILISLLLTLAWGVGIILLLYTPVRRYIMKQDFRSRVLYVTSDAIVYKVTKPAFIPWFGVSKIEKCILLPLITDIVLEQGCLQSLFGLHSIRIETLGQGPLDAYSVSVCGMNNPRKFRKAVLMATSALKKDASFYDSSFREKNVSLGLPRLHLQSSTRSQSFTSPQTVTDTPRQIFSHSYSDAHNPYVPANGETFLRKLEDIRIRAKKIETIILRQHGQTTDIFSDASDSEC